MENKIDRFFGKLFGNSFSFMRRFLFRILSIGPIPTHLSFILDGNRRYAKKWNIEEGMGYRAGFLALMAVMKYCFELGVKYVSIYAFSIDNFKRRPEEVQLLMDMLLEKVDVLLKEESLVKHYGLRIYFVGNLELLDERVRAAAQNAMEATSNNTRSILFICVAYTSTNEIVHAAQESCKDKWVEIQSLNLAPSNEISEEKHEGGRVVTLANIERHMYMGSAPDPDILIRTSGETRLSNFLLWQTSNCLLYSPRALWPEIGLRHIVWAVLNFQRIHPYLEKRRKKENTHNPTYLKASLSSSDPWYFRGNGTSKP